MKDYIINENRKAKHDLLWRTLTALENPKPGQAKIRGETYLNFSTNDYLGYSQNPRVIKAATEALQKYGAGGRSSRLISGTLDLHKQLEWDLAAFKGTEAAVLFPTGFMANLGVISAVLKEGDAIIIDRLNHASLVDAAKLAKCRIFVYEHRSISSLEKILRRTKSYKKRLVVTDSLFSMDGDTAPLDKIHELTTKHNVWLMIDDAHATGVLGENGIGLAESYGLVGKVEIVMGTLSKAMGSQGGFVCGSKDFIDYIVNRARPFIYTTALSPASCAAASESLKLIQEEPWRRKKLQEISRRLRGLLKMNFKTQSRYIEKFITPIIPFWTGTPDKAIQLSRFLIEQKIFAPAIRPPTVPKDECRVRFSLTSDHTQENIDTLVQVLHRSLVNN